MRVKLLTFKPNKNGDVTLYLGAGVDLRELIDLIGQEVIIEPAAGKEEKPVDDGLQAIIAMIQDYGKTNECSNRVKYLESNGITKQVNETQADETQVKEKNNG